MIEKQAEGLLEPIEVIAAALPPLGAYVLATKYADGDPGDPWALGFYNGEKNGRHYVLDGNSYNIRGQWLSPCRYHPARRWLLAA